MPFPPKLKDLTGTVRTSAPSASSTQRYERIVILEKAPELADFRRWQRSDGKQTESLFVLTHPFFHIVGPIGDLKPLLAPPLDFYAAYRAKEMRPPLPRAVESIFFPDNLPGLGIATSIFVLAYIALALRGGGVRPTPLAIVTAAILVLAYPATLSVWIGDSADYQRHNLTYSVFLRLGEILLFLVILETIALRFLPSAKATKGPAAVAEGSDGSADLVVSWDETSRFQLPGQMRQYFVFEQTADGLKTPRLAGKFRSPRAALEAARLAMAEREARK
jgi:hypothetical protein